MNGELLKIRLRKLARALLSPTCWPALRLGVAPSIEHEAVLRRLKVDGVLDVGANRGQFTLLCRLIYPGVPVVAFEPIPEEAVVFRRIHGRWPEVRLIESALGVVAGTATLHLSCSADSSSLLPIGRQQTELFAGTFEIGTLTVPVSRLDDLGEHWAGRMRLLLKLDVQGFELQVLRGAEATLRSCAYVYAECSEMPLYEGQALRGEVEHFLAGHGFRVLKRCNEQRVGGRLVQADYLFGRGRPG